MPDDVTPGGPEETAIAPSGAPTPARRPKRRLRRKLLLALGSFLFTLLVLEIAARVYMPSIGPVRIRGGYYNNPLPLVTDQGGKPIDLKYLPEGERLPADKAEGELRVFVLGESSVEGSPLDVRASMPAMLYDLLAERFPDRQVTVVNMGRSSSVAANAYYYTLYADRYEPDFIVYYMGMNDSNTMGGEQCAPVSTPTLHGLWRFAVGHSWALWLTRTFGVQLLWRKGDRDNWYEGKDCPERSFHLWTEILVEAARSTGATPIVATPVISAATVLEANFDRAESDYLPPLTPTYRETLACAVDDGCDLSARLLDVLQAAPELDERFWEFWDTSWCAWVAGADEDPAARPETARRATLCRGWTRPRALTLMDQHEEDVAYRAAAWERAVDRVGGELIPFDEILRQASPHGILAETWFADRQHLLPVGYLYLARLTFARIEHLLTGAPERSVAPPVAADARPYVDQSIQSGVSIAYEQLIRGWYITGLPMLTYAPVVFPPGTCERKGFCDDVDYARLAVGWIRQQVGLDPGLEPSLSARLADFRPLAILDELRRVQTGQGPTHTP